MKGATAGDKPEWFDRPAGITTATVCRISGHLAGEGCEDVEVAVGDEVSHRSMVYTEYFVSGTQPTEYCELHKTVGLFGKIAGLFGGGEKPPAPRLVEEPPPSRNGLAVVASDHIDVDPPVTARPKESKRGFWGRIFHRDDDEKNDVRRRSTSGR